MVPTIMLISEYEVRVIYVKGTILKGKFQINKKVYRLYLRNATIATYIFMGDLMEWSTILNGTFLIGST